MLLLVRSLGSPYFSPQPIRPFLKEVSAEPGRLRIALVTATPGGTPLDPECKKAALSAAKLCEGLGHSVEETTLPIDFELARGAFFAILQVLVARVIEDAAAILALFEAVQSGDASAMIEILGTGKELVSSGDEVEDKAEWGQFAAKYAEMHRFVRLGDGTAVLYTGAENWPFPFPLVSRDGRWFFDADTGTREVFFRKIGENELTVIQTCRALVSGDSQPATDESVLKYVRGFLNAQRSAVAPESTKAAGNKEPFHGYYFRALTLGKDKEVTSAAKVRPAFVAYPVEYRSSGVMTFVVTYDGAVYEKDLGPNTQKVAHTMTKWRSDSSWHPAE